MRADAVPQTGASWADSQGMALRLGAGAAASEGVDLGLLPFKLLELLGARCSGRGHIIKVFFLPKGLEAAGVQGMGKTGGFNKNNPVFRLDLANVIPALGWQGPPAEDGLQGCFTAVQLMTVVCVSEKGAETRGTRTRNGVKPAN